MHNSLLLTKPSAQVISFRIEAYHLLCASVRRVKAAYAIANILIIKPTWNGPF
jgi:hypothetical protein